MLLATFFLLGGQINYKMSSISIINALQMIENVIGVYRNFSMLKTHRNIIKLLIVIEICVIIVFYLYFFICDFAQFSADNFDTFYFVFYLYYISFEMVNSLMAIILSYCYSSFFKEFLLNINAVHQLYDADPIYQNLAKIQYKRFYVDFTIFTGAFILMIIVYAYDSFEVVELSVYYIIYFITGTAHQFRFFFQSFTLFQFIVIISDHLNYINASVKGTIKKMSEEEGIDAENDSEIRETRSKLEKWGIGTWRLMVACNCLRDCFGVQVNKLV